MESELRELSKRRHPCDDDSNVAPSGGTFDHVWLHLRKVEDHVALASNHDRITPDLEAMSEG